MAGKIGATDMSYCFLADYFDQQAAMIRSYHLFFFPVDNTVELFDIKQRRTFLKRCNYPSITLGDLYIGSQISIYSRVLKIKDFGDEFTRRELSVKKGKSLALIKPVAFGQWGEIISILQSKNYKIANMKMIQLSTQQAQQFYGDVSITQRVKEISNGPVLALEIVGPGIQQELLNAVGGEARERKNSSNQVDTSLQNALTHVHLAVSERNAETELDYIFNNPAVRCTATLRNCTLLVIKPHAVTEGHAGTILDLLIKHQFNITALQMFHLDRISAEEFLEVYKTVVPEYHSMVEQLTSGSSIAIEISSDLSSYSHSSTSSSSAASGSSSIVSLIRSVAGPSDPEIARILRPKSLRAQFGHTKVKNAVHVTDLEEDGELESEFFFSILQQPTNPLNAPSASASLSASSSTLAASGSSSMLAASLASTQRKY